ncbi:MAG: S-layer homology domain-containing protein [Leucobacter sp.]
MHSSPGLAGARWRVPVVGFVVALVLSLSGIASAPFARADDGFRTISGVVTLPNGADAALLSDVRVAAFGEDAAEPAVDPAAVSADGAYKLTGLEAGAYRVEVTVSGAAAEALAPALYGASHEQPEGRSVDVAAGDAEGIDIALAGIGDGSGAAAVTGEASAQEAPAGDPGTAAAEENPASRSDVAGLLPRADTLQTPEMADEGDELQAGAVPDRSDAAAAAALAAPSALSAEEPEDGGLIVGAATTGDRTISGQISLEAGDKTKLRVYLENVDGSSSGSPSRYLNNTSSSVPVGQRDTWNASTAEYSFRNLAPGRYRISFEYWSTSPVIVERWYPNALDRETAEAVDVRNGNATGVDGSLERGVALTGGITAPAGVDESTSNLVATNSSGGMWRLTWNKTADTYTSPAMPTDDYWVQLVGYDADYKLASMQFLKSGSATRFTPSVGSLLTRNLTGANPDASIEGKVYATGGLPKTFQRAANVYQVLDGVHFPLYYSWMGSEGPYLKLGLAPGNYKVEFTAKTGRDVAKGEWWNQKATRDSATVIALTAGKKVTGVNGTLRTSSSGRVPPFKDVKSNDKFYDEIAWMYYSGISTGTMQPDGRYYYPSQSVSRGATAAFMFRMNAPADYQAPAKSPFADVPKSHKFYKEISWMYASGLSTGTKVGGSRYYHPSQSVSREAMAAFMFRQYAPSNYQKPGYSPFADVKTSHKFFREISWMYSSGLSTGIQRDYQRFYEPGKPVTREAMAAFLFRNALSR